MLSPQCVPAGIINYMYWVFQNKKKYLFFSILVFMSSWNFMLRSVEHEKKFYNLEA